MLMFQLLLTTTTNAVVIAPPAKLVILGPGCPSVQLIAAKKAAAMGFMPSAVVRDRRNALKLMYGSTDDDVESRAKAAESNAEIGSALTSAEACLLIAEAGGETGIRTTLQFAPALKRLVLLTSIGGSTGNGGATYMGEGEAIQRMEAEVQERCASVGVEVSIVRVGVLKGGGPPHGLDAGYYDTLRIGGYPTPNFACAQSHDQQTLGVSVTAGDTVEPRSAIARSASKTDVGPKRDEISRIVAAEAMLSCLRQPEAVHVTLSAEYAEAPPSTDEWDGLLCNL